jgi:hypothetical protein
MRFTAELKERNRMTVPIIVTQGLCLKRGDFIEVTVEVIKRVVK